MAHNKIFCRNEYVPMRDGICLAVSIWRNNDYINCKEKRPAVIITTRYWRAMAFNEDAPEFQRHYPLASHLCSGGYALVVADARGSGGSFGCRQSELSLSEVLDIDQIIDWAGQQNWCDGRVAAIGTSYTANTALHSLATTSSALKLTVCRAPDFDIYRHLFAPGGIVNDWFIKLWGTMTAALDANDAMIALEGFPGEQKGGADNVLGVRPVDNDTDGALLAAAIAEHKFNFNTVGMADKLTFIDNAFFDSSAQRDSTSSDLHGQINSGPQVSHYFFSNPYFFQDNIEQGNIPIVIRCGWHDAATQLGALSMFTSFSNPMRVILGPWNHGGDFRVDPFGPDGGRQPESIPSEYGFGLIVKSLNATLKNSSDPLADEFVLDQFGIVEYYTLGENQWKATSVWPLPQTKMQRLYLSADHQLSGAEPQDETACDIYRVDPTVSTGVNNRWGCQMGEPVFFDDRREDDKKLLVYDSRPLKHNVEITGHPVVHLYVRSTASDGQFFAYLETIDPDGRVRWLTDGQLRALHRKVSDDEPPFTMFGPYHSFKEKDAEALVPGEVAEITFDLLPISVLLKKGQRIRLAIAGADCDIFSPIVGCESPEITVERNRVYSSFIDLPII